MSEPSKRLCDSPLSTLHSPLPFRLGHRRWLDGLRGVAIAAVLAFHFGLLPGGSIGVDLFFVLSGFLITCLLLEEHQQTGGVHLGRFYMRRGLRLLPAFGVLLAVCVTTSLLWNEEGGLREVAVAGLYLANWPGLHQTSLPRLGHCWSLAVEEQFYLVWPIVLAFVLRSRLTRRQVVGLVIAGIVASAVWRATLYRLAPAELKTATVMRLYMGSDSRADSLLAGCLTAMLVSWGFVAAPVRNRWRLGSAALAATIVVGYLAWNRCLDHSQYYNGLFTGVAALVGLTLIHMLLAPSAVGLAILESSPLVATGKLSYALYLYHMPIIFWLKPAGLGWSHPGPTLLVAALTFAAAGASYFLIERPCLRLKSRFQHRPSTPRQEPLSRAA